MQVFALQKLVVAVSSLIAEKSIFTATNYAIEFKIPC